MASSNIHRPRLADNVDRECLANAIQSNVEDIVRDVVFTESELPDLIVSYGCLSEDDCCEIRRLGQRRDQIRLLVSTIKGKDLNILQTFLHCIAEVGYQHIADKINAAFSENKNDTFISRQSCFYSELMYNVDIKQISDRMWSIQAISDGLYKQIAKCKKPAGSQNELWRHLFEELNRIADASRRNDAYRQLKCALNQENYGYIASTLDTCPQDIQTTDKCSHKRGESGRNTIVYHRNPSGKVNTNTPVQVEIQDEEHQTEEFRSEDYVVRRLKELLLISDMRRRKLKRHAVYVSDQDLKKLKRQGEFYEANQLNKDIRDLQYFEQRDS